MVASLRDTYGTGLTPEILNRNDHRVVHGKYFTPRTTSFFGRGRNHNAMTEAEIDAAVESSIYASDLQNDAITKAIAASNVTQSKNTDVRGYTEAQMLEGLEADRRSNSIQSPDATAGAVEAKNAEATNAEQNRNGMGDFMQWAAEAATGWNAGLEPGGMTTEGEETVLTGKAPDYTDDYANESDNWLGWLKDQVTEEEETVPNFTPDTISEGPHEDEPTYAYDPIPGRNLGILDASKGSFYDTYNAPQTKGSIAMGWLGSLVGPGLPARGLATWAGRKVAGDKPSGWAGRAGALGQGDRFANLLAAQHYADKGPEGWLQSGFVGNYNPQSAGGLWSPGSQHQDVGGQAEVTSTLGDVGAYLGGLFSGDEAEGEESDGGWFRW